MCGVLVFYMYTTNTHGFYTDCQLGYVTHTQHQPSYCCSSAQYQLKQQHMIQHIYTQKPRSGNASPQICGFVMVQKLQYILRHCQPLPIYIHNGCTTLIVAMSPIHLYSCCQNSITHFALDLASDDYCHLTLYALKSHRQRTVIYS